MKRIRNLITTFVFISALFVIGTPRAMAWDDCDEGQSQPVVSGAGIGGHATLCIENGTLTTTMRTERLTPGAAYTVWFAYFDNPANCKVAQQCGGPDLVNPAENPTGAFGRMDSAVAGPHGRLTFHGNFRGFEPARGSMVMLFLFTHGTADSTDLRARARQLLTPETPMLGAPGLGVGVRKGFGVAQVTFQIN